MRVLWAVAFGLALVLSACVGSGEPAEPTPDVGAEVRTAVAAALPTATPSPTLDIDATVEAGMAATMEAMPTSAAEATTPSPTRRPISNSTLQTTPTPFLTSTPYPTATPRPRATATTRPPGSYDFGPLRGELRHGSSAADYKRAGLRSANVMVEATFINPYRGSASKRLSYGFVIRHEDNNELQFILSSTGWEVNALVEGTYQSLAHNSTSYLNTGEGASNHLMVIAMITRSLIFVNGQHVGSVNVYPVTEAGDVLIGANLHAGDGIPGVVIRYEGFKGNSLKNSYRASSGHLIQHEPGSFGTHFAGQKYRDFVAEAEFTRPVPSRWDLGFLFRSPENNRLEVLVVSNRRSWSHFTRNVGDSSYIAVDEGSLNSSGMDTYQIMLIAVGDSGWFFINGQHVTKLDLGHNQDTGGLAVIGDFFDRNDSSLEYRYFRVWAP